MKCIFHGIDVRSSITKRHRRPEGWQASRGGPLLYFYFKVYPKHSHANHNMGVLAVDIGKIQEALPFFKTAIEADPSTDQYWISYIDALIKLNRVSNATAVFNQARSNGAKGDSFDKLEKRLTSSESKNTYGQDPPKKQLDSLLKLYNQQKLQQVFNNAQRLTKRYSKSLTLWNLMGASAAQIGKLDEAVLAFKKALLIKPDYAEVHYNLGNALRDQEKLQEAIEAYGNALSIKPITLMPTLTWVMCSKTRES